MKKGIFSFAFIFLVFTTISLSQPLSKEDLPPGLIYEFGNRYPGVQKVTWTLEDDLYCAEFIFIGNQVKVKYDKLIKWVYSETVYTKENLPKTIMRYVTSKYPDYIIENAKFTETSFEDGHFYVQTKTGNETKYIIFDKNGVFLKITDEYKKIIYSDIIPIPVGSNPISTRELPPLISSYLMVNYSGFRISESYFVNSKEWENVYYIVLTSNVEKEKVLLWFDFRGNLLKKMDPHSTEIQKPKPEEEKVQKPEYIRKPLPEALVPRQVRDAFAERVKKYEGPSWDTLKHVYIASYTDPVRRENCKAHFTRTGEWILTTVEIEHSKIHANILQYINENFKPVLADMQIYSAESVVTAERKKYIIVKIYDAQWLNEPMVYHELYFTTSGRFEREILADYIDPREVQLKEYEKQKSEKFFEFVDEKGISTAMESFTQIKRKELPSKILRHIRDTFPEHRLAEAYVVVDDLSDETEYWVVLKSEREKKDTKVVYDFKGNFISKSEF